MQRRSVLGAGFLFVLITAAGCGGGPTTAAPTGSGSPSTTGSATASPSPSAAPSPSYTPPPETIDVFGQIGFQVIVLEGGKTLKEPFDIILTLRSVESGEMIPAYLKEGGNFS